MKKWLLLALFSGGLFSCGDKERGPFAEKTIVYNGDAYDITFAAQDYRGGSMPFIDLVLEFPGGSVDIDLAVTAGRTRLVAGTYDLANALRARVRRNVDGYTVSDYLQGTLKVVISGGGMYTLALDATGYDGSEVSVTYFGVLRSSDQQGIVRPIMIPGIYSVYSYGPAPGSVPDGLNAVEVGLINMLSGGNLGADTYFFFIVDEPNEIVPAGTYSYSPDNERNTFRSPLGTYHSGTAEVKADGSMLITYKSSSSAGTSVMKVFPKRN